MNFQFVENGKIDGATRKLIRSHVMKGKNMGRVLTRPTRKDENTGGAEKPAVAIPQAVGDAFSTFTFPCQVQPYMRDLIHQIMFIGGQELYPKEFCLPIDVTQSLVFQYLLTDEAFFYSVLAMTDVSIDSLSGRNNTSPRTLMHLCHTYRCIRRNLERDRIPSASTAAAIMGMAIHEDLTGQPGRSKVHIDALQRIVELRGGIARFGETRLILQKICRADIRYSLHAGSYPRFNRDEFPHELVRSMRGELVPQDIFSLENGTQVYDPKLRNILVDSMDVSYCFNSDKAFVKLDPYDYQEILISIFYRLLHRYPLSSNGPENSNERSCYLGLIALLAMLLFQHPPSRRLQYDLLGERLRSAIERAPRGTPAQETIVLWLLFAGGIFVFGVTDRAWLIPEIKMVIFTLKLDSWQTARRKIKTLPWIDAVHDKPAEDLWQAIIEEPYCLLPDQTTPIPETDLRCTLDG